MAATTPASTDNYSPLTPLIVHLGMEDGAEGVHLPLEHLEDRESAQKATFKLPVVDRGKPIAATPQALSELYLSDHLIDRIVAATNAYAKKRLPENKVVLVERAHVLRFFAIYYYMGLVKLPAKDDYWRTDTSIWPSHPVCQSMSRAMYLYLWQNIHLTEADKEELLFGNSDDEEEDETSHTEPIQAEQEDDDDGIEERWFDKAQWFLAYVNEVSHRLCVHPGQFLSIDEMMKPFKGRSIQTHRMKNKPIKEGNKFFAVCDAETGFVYTFIPDGRMEKSTIAENVFGLVDSLPGKQENKYVIKMDNYFTTSCVVKGLRERNVGVIGTARARSGWPPKKFQAIEETRFNCVHLLGDKNDFLIARWVDNNVVTMVSTVHSGKEIVTCTRKKPRVTATNEPNLQAVWGETYRREIAIPRMIDDYNHWMGGVDKADQLISYYRPTIRCRRTWISLMLHGLDII